MPPGTGRVAAVALVPDSGGVCGTLLDHWPKRLDAAGIAALALAMFGPHGV
ncbi:hypothetical protein BURK1_03369 [Burkholderiales bacterium]|nr:hypothetical protein BURK1_03369 [Burkholderiales bacterium]